MRILMTTRGSAGHLIPLAPFAHACLRAGHDVLVAAQAQHRANVERTGLPFAATADPPRDEWVPLMARFAGLGVTDANAQMIAEFFAGIDVRAGLPGQRAIVEEWRPDIIVRETCEFAGALTAELAGIPLARVGLGLAASEEYAIELAAAAVDRARIGLGLPRDPAGGRLRETPYLTMVPEPLEHRVTETGPRALRFAHPMAEDAAPPPPDWWPGNEDPLVYLTFGSVTAGAHLPYFPALYRAALDALAPLPARILLTIGDDRDPTMLGPLAANVHVERWVAHDAVAAHAAAVVCHGGYGTTLGTLRHGVPLVVMPYRPPAPASRWTPNATRVRSSDCPAARRSARWRRRCAASWPTAPTGRRRGASPMPWPGWRRSTPRCRR
jgi:UDP:flavonoid glycosyltransferase YjiC (YdhE family)